MTSIEEVFYLRSIYTCGDKLQSKRAEWRSGWGEASGVAGGERG